MSKEHKEYEDFPQSEFDCIGAFSMSLAFSVIGGLTVVIVMLGVVALVWC